MHTLNAKKYEYYIQKIKNASIKDILEQGILGAASEISSAQKQEPYGCWLQAWSCATFIELMHIL